MSLDNAILLVEDTPSHANLVIKILSHYGFQVIWKKTGQEAYDYCVKSNPNLFLVDIALPDMTGVDVLKKIKSNPPPYPIMIAITAHSMSKTKDELMEAGFDDYIPKPFTVDELMDKIRKYVKVKG